MNPSYDPDAAVKCPECGAQLVVNLGGQRRFTCGREDVYGADDAGRECRVIAVSVPCRTSEFAIKRVVPHVSVGVTGRMVVAALVLGLVLAGCGSPSPKPSPSPTPAASLTAVPHGVGDRMVEVFLKDLTRAESQSMATEVAAMPEVEAYHFVSKAEALKRFSKYNELATKGMTAKNNPLPPSFEILLKKGTDVAAFAHTFYKDPRVANSASGTTDGVQYEGKPFSEQ